MPEKIAYKLQSAYFEFFAVFVSFKEFIFCRPNKSSIWI